MTEWYHYYRSSSIPHWRWIYDKGILYVNKSYEGHQDMIQHIRGGDDDPSYWDNQSSPEAYDWWGGFYFPTQDVSRMGYFPMEGGGSSEEINSLMDDIHNRLRSGDYVELKGVPQYD